MEFNRSAPPWSRKQAQAGTKRPADDSMAEPAPSFASSRYRNTDASIVTGSQLARISRW